MVKKKVLRVDRGGKEKQKQNPNMLYSEQRMTADFSLKQCKQEDVATTEQGKD